MRTNWMSLGAIIGLGLLGGCGVADGASVEDPAVSVEAAVEVGESDTGLISSCYDWNGTCTGLPEGAACGTNGTCVPDTFGVSGWCHCYIPPPPQVCQGTAPCGGHVYYSSCVKSSGGLGACFPGYFGKASGSNCGCF